MDSDRLLRSVNQEELRWLRCKGVSSLNEVDGSAALNGAGSLRRYTVLTSTKTQKSKDLAKSWLEEINF